MYIAAICGTHHKVKVALVVIERGVVSRQHSAFEYCVRRARSRAVHVAANLKHFKHSVNAIRAIDPSDNASFLNYQQNMQRIPQFRRSTAVSFETILSLYFYPLYSETCLWLS